MKHYIVSNPVMSQNAARRAKTLTVFETPVTLADGSKHGFLSPRTAAYFAREIGKAPADDIILIDLHNDEREAFEAALSRSPRARACILESKHAVCNCIRAGFTRVALLPVGVKAPKSAEDRALTCYTLPEIVKGFCSTRYDYFEIRIAQPSGIASRGGAARAHYKDAEIEAAFIEYRRQNPSGTLWNACRWLTKPGHALDRYKKDPARCLLRHVKSLAKRSDGFFEDEKAWFRFLLPDSKIK